MHNPITVTGVVKNGTLFLNSVPDEIAGSAYVANGILQDETSFNSFDDGTNIQCTVLVNATRRGTTVSLIQESIRTLIETAGSEVVNGWTNIHGVWFENNEEVTTFEAHTAIAHNGGLYGNILIVGESGYGKTARAKAWAQYKKMNFVRVNVALVRDEQSIFGVAGYDGEHTLFNESEASEIMQAGNAVLLLDEINRTKPKTLNGVFSILDDDRRVVLSTPAGNKVIQLGKGVLIMGTANIGFKFVGTEPIDAALRNRFADTIEVLPPPMEVEVTILRDKTGIDQDTAESIILILNKIRHEDKLKDADIDITTRKALQLATKYVHGVPLKTAFKTGVLNNLRDNARAYKDANDIISYLL